MATLIVHPATADRPQSTEFTLQVKDLSLKEGNTRFHNDPKVALEVELQPGDRESQVTKIRRLKLLDSRFSFAGAGVLHSREGLPSLDLQGEVHPRAAA